VYLIFRVSTYSLNYIKHKVTIWDKVHLKNIIWRLNRYLIAFIRIWKTYGLLKERFYAYWKQHKCYQPSSLYRVCVNSKCTRCTCRWKPALLFSQILSYIKRVLSTVEKSGVNFLVASVGRRPGRHRDSRLIWARLHSRLTRQRWNRIVFTD
jgi:hypothetical protein